MTIQKLSSGALCRESFLRIRHFQPRNQPYQRHQVSRKWLRRPFASSMLPPLTMCPLDRKSTWGWRLRLEVHPNNVGVGKPVLWQAEEDASAHLQYVYHERRQPKRRQTASVSVFPPGKSVAVVLRQSCDSEQHMGQMLNRIPL